MHSSAIKSKHSSSSVPGMNYILLMRLKYQWFLYSFIVAEGQLIKAAKTIALGSRDAEIHFAASEDRQASSDRQNRAVNMRRGNDDDDDDDDDISISLIISTFHNYRSWSNE